MQSAVKYLVPLFTVDPSWCSITYSHTVTAVEGDSAVTFDALTPEFTFFYNTDTSISGPDFKDYTVSVIGTSGIVTPIGQTSSFNLRLRNPCIDPTYVTIISSPNLTYQTYVLFDLEPNGLLWTESPFTIDPDPLAATLCGNLSLTATFNGGVITSTSTPLSFDETTNQFALYSEDFTLLGTQVYSLQASLINYPSVESVEVLSNIRIDDPCPSPVSVTANQLQTNPNPYLYTGVTDQVTFTLAPFSVDPSVCPFFYQC